MFARTRHSRRQRFAQPTVQALEDRTVLSHFVPPAPIQPNLVEQQLLNGANALNYDPSHPNSVTAQALDAYPIPFVIVAQSADETKAVRMNALPDIPIPINVDANNANLGLNTGLAGFDLLVTLKTHVLPNVSIELEFMRLSTEVCPDLRNIAGLPISLRNAINVCLMAQASVTVGSVTVGSTLVKNFSVFAVFPFEAFTEEIGAGGAVPNLFLGYETRAVNDQPGGNAPVKETLEFTPRLFNNGILSSLNGTNHTMEIDIDTFHPDNPLRLIGGTFDYLKTGSNPRIVNAMGVSTYLETADGKVPEHINIALDVGASKQFGGPSDTRYDVFYTASQSTFVQADYFEDESFPLNAHQLQTTVIIDEMPTSEHLTLHMQEGNQRFVVEHRASAVIDKIQLLSRREDGMLIIGTLEDIPTGFEIDLNLAGKLTYKEADPNNHQQAVEPTVHANSLDVQLEVIQQGGFVNTSGFLGYNLGYLRARAENIPALSVEFEPTQDQVIVQAIHPGESIGYVELMIDDDTRYQLNAEGYPIALVPNLLVLPPSYHEGLDQPGVLHHLLSYIETFDTKLHGTAVARLVRVAKAVLDLDADASEAFHLELAAPAAPMQASLRTPKQSHLLPNHDIQATLDIDNVPYGTWDFFLDSPMHYGYETTPAQTIGSIHLYGDVGYGHIDTLNFEASLLNLPARLEVFVDPNAFVELQADNDGNKLNGVDTGQIGLITARLWDGVKATGLPGLTDLFHRPMREIELRVDQIPSFKATWADSAVGTNLNFNTTAEDSFLGGAQFELSSVVNGAGLPSNFQTHEHYARFIDEGPSGKVEIAAGVFEIDEVSYSTIDALDLTLIHYDDRTARPLDVDIHTNFGNVFFPNHKVDVTLDILNVPQLVDVTMNTDADPFVVIEASSRINSIVLTANDDDTNNGATDPLHLDAMILDLPATFGVFVNPESGMSILAEDELGDVDVFGNVVTHGNPDALGALIAQVSDPNGIVDTTDLLGQPIRQARVRVDHIPSFHLTYSDNDAGTKFDFNTDANDEILGGAQFAVSTQIDLLPLVNGDPDLPGYTDLDHYVRFLDNGAGAIQIGAGVFGIDQVTYTSDDLKNKMALHYDTDVDRRLVLDAHSAFGGRFFPFVKLDATLVVDDIPQLWDFVLDAEDDIESYPGTIGNSVVPTVGTTISYTASDEIAAITLDGIIDFRNDGVANGTVVNFDFNGLPAEVRLDLLPSEIEIIDGKLDLPNQKTIKDGEQVLAANGTVDGNDDGVIAGVTITDGMVGLPDGTKFFGIPVIGGRLDVTEIDGVNEHDDGGLAGIVLGMSDNIDLVSLRVTSQSPSVGIFGTDYDIAHVAVTNIPGRWVIGFGGGRLYVEATDPDGNPEAMGEIMAFLSTEASFGGVYGLVEPFVLDPANRINYSDFTRTIDDRYYNSGIDSPPSGVLSRLNQLYGNGEELSLGTDGMLDLFDGDPLDDGLGTPTDDEDHLLARLVSIPDGGDDDDELDLAVTFASLEFTGFQKLAAIPNENGGHYELRVPVDGEHPIFVGAGIDNMFATIQIQNLPDVMTLDVDTENGHIHFKSTDDENSSIGEVDALLAPFVPGVGLFADDGDTALRAVMLGTPYDVEINWDFGFPDGTAQFIASNQFEVLFLAQDGDTRAVGGLTLQELEAQYHVAFPFDLEGDLEWYGPSVDLEVVRVTAGIDNEADGAIGAGSGPGVSGFLEVYELRDDLHDLSYSDVGHDAEEYVPAVTFMMREFKLFELEVSVDVELAPAFLSPEIEVDKFNLEGQFMLDFWANGDTDATLLGFGFRNRPDYSENSPIHIIPGDLDDPDFDAHGTTVSFNGFHGFDAHFDPYGGNLTATGEGSASGDPSLLTQHGLDHFFGNAIARWYGAGASHETILSLINNTRFVAADLPGSMLGEASAGMIRIDTNAAGYGWFIDATPHDDVEFPATELSPAWGRFDLLTVLAHEIGHALGIGHSETGVMAASLMTGTRRSPTSGDLNGPADGGSHDDDGHDWLTAATFVTVTVPVTVLGTRTIPVLPVASFRHENAALLREVGNVFLPRTSTPFALDHKSKPFDRGMSVDPVRVKIGGAVEAQVQPVRDKSRVNVLSPATRDSDDSEIFAIDPRLFDPMLQEMASRSLPPITASLAPARPLDASVAPASLPLSLSEWPMTSKLAHRVPQPDQVEANAALLAAGETRDSSDGAELVSRPDRQLVASNESVSDGQPTAVPELAPERWDWIRDPKLWVAGLLALMSGTALWHRHEKTKGTVPALSRRRPT